MAEATTQITVTPKQLGKHLRTIRRKKGLSLSEVARGAGLSRRELVSYERGKLPIPESDLWVLAGSCGVDVAELMPSASSMELTAAASATSVGDTVSQLRKGQEDAGITQYLHTLHKLQALPAGKRIPVKERELEDIATALGSTPRSIEEKLREVLNVDREEAERLRAMILVPPGGRGKPRALAAAPSALAAAALAPAPAPVEAPIADRAPAPDLPAPVAPDVPAVPLTVAAEVAPDVTPEATDDPLQTFPAAPAAFLDQPLDAPIDPVHGHNVDVFEELARLPEPVPLGDPSAPLPDLLAPPDPFASPLGVPAIGPPEGTVELVDSTMPDPAVVAAGGAAAWNAADAPPIDVALRQGSSTWDLGEPPLVATPAPAPLPTDWETDGWQPPAPDGAEGATNGFWGSTDDWAPPVDAADSATTEGPATEVIEVASGEPVMIGEDTWAGAAWDPEPWSPTDAAVAPPETTVVDVNPWATEQWPSEPADRGAWEHQPDPAAVDSGFYVDWGTPETEAPAALETFAESTIAPEPVEDEVVPAWGAWAPSSDVTTVDDAETIERVEAEPADAAVDAEPVADATWGPWGTWAPPDAVDTAEPDTVGPELVDTVEPVDTSHPVDTFHPVDTIEPVDTFHPVDTVDTVEPEPVDTSHPVDTIEPEPVDTFHPVDTVDTVEPEPVDTVEPEPVDTFDTIDTFHPVDTVDTAEPEPVDEPAFISWHADDAPEVEPELERAAVDVDSDPESGRVTDEFVTAGPDWQLGNAMPLVEVRGEGGLVMRRADERWALADITTTPDFVAEVEVDFRSGPGLGVLFRASTDEDGRMSGYSFDIDPIYDGGGYLVRQWQADRELWNPIARVSGDDPSAMYGTLLVRIEVVGEHLSAQVNGVEVLAVENLKQASADRGRDGATGDRIGVQAWSSSDLVIDTARVAAR